MTISSWLKASENQLSSAGIATARLDCLVLLSDQLGKDKSWLLTYPEFELQGSDLEILNNKIVQRAKHTPLAYLRERAEFYGREFAVDEHVLVPRPETEAMIDLLKMLFLATGTNSHSKFDGGSPARHPGLDPGSSNKNSADGTTTELDYSLRWNDNEESVATELLGPGTCILDVGTGSGCIAITAALELPEAFVQACDIDRNCVDLAEQNVETLGASVHVFQSDLLSNVGACDVLLCNLPYVPDGYTINTAATHEPKLALFAGTDGLDLYRRMFQQIAAHNWQPKYILTEALPEQHQALAVLAKTVGFQLQTTNDFIQLFVSKT